MSPAQSSLVQELRPRIIERQVRLRAAARKAPADYVNELLAEIDAALQRIEQGSYGLCETCHDPIETDRLEHNPLTRFCLDHLTARERRAHEQDLTLAMQIQSRLLPPAQHRTRFWEAQYRYEPAGAVGGDYCEMVASADGTSLFFAIGDVAGKGVAASLLMAHLSAIFRSLLSLDLPLAEVVSRANRLFCESTPTTHYATLVAGRASQEGLELCNAGHCEPLLVDHKGIRSIESMGLPLGLFADVTYGVRHIETHPGDSLILYTDGLTEAQDPVGNLYEESRLIAFLRSRMTTDAGITADAALRDVSVFRETHPQGDDMTVLVLRQLG